MRRNFIIKVLLVLSMLFIWQCGIKREVPGELMGIWKTNDQKYIDRSFELTRNTISFGVGNGEFEVYIITKIAITEVREERSVLYTVYYEDGEGDTYTFAFYHYPEQNGVIRLKNQNEIVWSKENK